MTAEGKDRFTKVEISEGHFIHVGTIDPEVQKQMPPPGSKPFTQVGFGEFLVKGFKGKIKKIREALTKS